MLQKIPFGAGFTLPAALLAIADVAVCAPPSAPVGQMVITVESRSGHSPAGLHPEDVMAYSGKTRVPVTDLQKLDGEHAGMQFFILLDDSSATSSLGVHLPELRDFVKSLPATTEVAIGYMRSGGFDLVQGFTTDHTQAAATLRLPGSVAGAFGYRRELAGQGPRLRRLVPATVLGGIAGAVLLLTLPPGAFARIVPALIGLALVLVIIQPWLARRLAARGRDRPEHGGPLLWIGILLTGVYGGYFGAAQGVLLLAVMGILLSDPVQRLNAAKNVFGAVANLVSGIVFVFAAHVAWLVVLLIAVGSTAGGLIGARIGRKLPPIALRVIIVAVGVVAIVRLLVP